MSKLLPPVIVAVKRPLSASAEQVFDAWINPDVAKQFFFTTVTGTVLQYDMNPKLGEGFTIIERRPKADGGGTMDVRHIGHYIEIDAPRRLVFSFSVPDFPGEETVVSVDIAPLSSGGCELTLTHGLGSSETARQSQDEAEAGWNTVLERLESATAP